MPNATSKTNSTATIFGKFLYIHLPLPTWLSLLFVELNVCVCVYVCMYVCVDVISMVK